MRSIVAIAGRLSIGCLVCIAAGANPAFAVSIQGVGDLPGGSFRSTITGVSANGSVVVGLVSTDSSHSSQLGQVYRWTSDTGMQGLGIPGVGGIGSFPGPMVSANGSTIAGNLSTTLGGFTWTQSSGLLPIPQSFLLSGITSTGNAVFGSNRPGNSLPVEAARFQRANGWAPENLTEGVVPANSYATASAANGLSAAVWREGTQVFELYRWQAFGPTQFIATVPSTGVPTAMSADGRVIVSPEYIWSEASGLQTNLGDFEPFNVSADGSVILGRMGSAAALRIGNGPVQLVSTYLAGFGVSLTDWQLSDIVGISADRSVLVGNGVHFGNEEGWVAVVPEPSSAAGAALLAVSALARRRGR